MSYYTHICPTTPITTLHQGSGQVREKRKADVNLYGIWLCSDTTDHDSAEYFKSDLHSLHSSYCDPMR